MDLFNTLSEAINPKGRIKHLESLIAIHYESIHDIEQEIQTLKSQLHDTNKSCKNPSCTVVDDDDVPIYSFV